MEQEWQRLLFFGAAQGHDDLIGHALKNGADLEAINEQGCTPLLLAVLYGHAATVSHLLYRGANVHATTPKGETAVSLAAINGHSSVVKLLMAHGADRKQKKPAATSKEEWPSAGSLKAKASG